MSNEQLNPDPVFDAVTSAIATSGEPAANGMVSFALIAPLEQSWPWARILCVLGSVLTGITPLAFCAIAVFGLATDLAVTLIVVLVGVPLALLVFGFPSWLLHRYGCEVITLSDQRSLRQFEATLEAQRRLWCYVGRVGLVIAVLMIVGFGVVTWWFATRLGG